MDAKYEKIHNHLQQYTNSHPNLVNIWKKYLNMRKNIFDRAMNECQTAMNIFEKYQDLSPEQISILLILHTNTT